MFTANQTWLVFVDFVDKGLTHWVTTMGYPTL